ncbi:hypothetical protein AGMMS4956_07950 [Bacteroidia bacterium]|nr:hypothetical protein AGMMS4956_07950 [Bacteroidia bacterium]
MPKINEATDTDLKVIDTLQTMGWKRGDTLLYQQSYILTEQQQKQFEGKKSIKPDIVLQDLNGSILAVFENKFEDEKKALSKLRSLYATILKPRFLYACSPERTLFYDTEWKGLESGEFRQVDRFMTLEEMQLKIEQARRSNLQREIVIDKSIAGGINPSHGKETYYQTKCIQTLIQKYKEGKQKMLVHMATGLGKTRTMVAFVKALLEYNMAKRVLFVVDRIMLAEQAITDGFSLISTEYTAVRITSGNYKQYKNAQIHVVVIDTLENIHQNISSNFYDLIIVDECHRSININRKMIFDHFLCPRIGLTATPRTAVAKEGKDIPDEDLAILDTYRLFGCEIGEPDYQFDLTRGIDEGFLAPYQVLSIETELTKTARETGVNFDHYFDLKTEELVQLNEEEKIKLEQLNRKFIARETCLRVAEEIKKNTPTSLNLIKEKAKANTEYEPSEKEIDTINTWSHNPEVFLDEGQLRKIYDFEQGSIWDFFLHGAGIKKIPTPKERIERGYDTYIKTYNFNDQQIMVLRKIKGLVSANVADKKRISPQEIFDNPFYARAIGYDFQEVNQLFDNQFFCVFNNLQTTFKI